MRTTHAGRLLAGAILAALLTASSASARKDDQAEVLMRAARKPFPCTKRSCFSADQPDRVAEARSRLSVPSQPAGLSNGSTRVVAPIPVAEGPVHVVKTLLPTDPRNASRLTVLAGMPDWVWCMLHFCKRWS